MRKFSLLANGRYCCLNFVYKLTLLISYLKEKHYVYSCNLALGVLKFVTKLNSFVI